MPRSSRRIIPVLLLAATPPAAGEEPVSLEADRISVTEDRVDARGKVQARQGEREMSADRIRYDRPGNWLDLFGDVTFSEPGYTATTPRARLNTETELGWMASPRLHLEDSDSWLLAEGLKRYASHRFRLTGACYTACSPPENPPWSVRSSRIYVNQETHFAHHWNSRFSLAGIPVFYTPYFGHYTDSERHTGFLFPAIEFSGRRGTDITLPFYWNIAPQLDATIGVRHMTGPGTMPQLEVRHLGKRLRSEVYAEYLPDDDQTGEDRYYFSTLQEGTLSGSVRYRLDGQRVSDAEHLSLFGEGVEQGSQRYLTSTLSLSRAFGAFRWSTDFTYLQDLQDFNAPDTLQELPRMRLEGETLLPGASPLQLDLDSEYVFFYRREGERDHRLYADPTLALPLSSRYGDLEPRAGVHWTRYRVIPDPQVTPGIDRESLSRTVPHASLRAASEVQRAFDLGAFHLRHAVGPELFYLYIPYRDQAGLPVLDTSAPPLRFGDLFEMNRFSGIDRIGDANQLTTALATRLDAKAGERRWEAASLRVGQVQYFGKRRVSLSDSAKPRTRTYSNVFAELAVRPLPTAELTSALEFDPQRPAFALNQMEAFDARLTVAPPAGHRLQARYLRRTAFDGEKATDTTEELEWDALAVLTPGWDLFARSRRSLLFRENLERRAGVDYHAGCWGLRLAWEDRLLRQAEATADLDDPEREIRVFLTLRFRTLGEQEFSTEYEELESGIRRTFE